MFWVHIQAQISALQTLTSTFPWSLGLYNPYIHLDIHLNSPVSIQPLTRNLAPRLTDLPSQVPICSWVERSNGSVKCLAQGHNERTHRQGILNLGLDLDPNPESCTLPLDQLAAVQVRQLWTAAIHAISDNFSLGPRTTQNSISTYLEQYPQVVIFA